MDFLKKYLKYKKKYLILKGGAKLTYNTDDPGTQIQILLSRYSNFKTND